MNEEEPKTCGNCYWFDEICGSIDGGVCYSEKNDRKTVPVVVKKDDPSCWDWEEE